VRPQRGPRITIFGFEQGEPRGRGHDIQPRIRPAAAASQIDMINLRASRFQDAFTIGKGKGHAFHHGLNHIRHRCAPRQIKESCLGERRVMGGALSAQVRQEKRP
jgi:hypothetical protein